MPVAFSCDTTGLFDILAVESSFPELPDDLVSVPSAD
jgi:hypothetical protein